MRILCLAIGALLLLVSAHAKDARAETVRIGQFESFFLQYVGEPIIIEAYRRLSKEVDFVQLPARRTVFMANEGQLDGEMMRTKGILRAHKNLIPIDVPLFTNAAYAIAIDPEIQILKWDDLKGYRVGILNGLMSIEHNTEPYDVSKANSFESLFGMLLRDRVDVVVAPLFSAAKEVIKFNKLKTLQIHYPPLHTKDHFHFVNKDHKYLVPDLTRVLQDLKDEGFIDKQLQKAFIELELPYPNHY